MSAGSGSTILVVDDSPTMRGMIVRALVAGGYQVVEASDGIDGLSRLQGDVEIQAILTDINMPRMDGVAFIRAVRQIERFARTPVLALTTEYEPDVKAAGKAAGATGWIVKPFAAEQLCSVIGMVIRRMVGQDRAHPAPESQGA
jgi:two-component system, chemotaxis family, chemotaxis protein CheY